MIKSNDNPLRKLIWEMVPGMFILTVIAYIISLIWGFRLSVLIGFLLGFAYVTLSHFYMAETILRAVRQSKKKAQRMMFFCYLLRYLLLILLCLIAVRVKVLNVFAILVPQFFPRLVLMFNNLKERKAVKNDKSTDD